MNGAMRFLNLKRYRWVCDHGLQHHVALTMAPQKDKAILRQTPQGFVHIYLHDDNGNLKGIHPDAIVKHYSLDCREDGTLVIPPAALPEE